MVTDWPLNESVFYSVTIKTHDGEHVLNETGKTYLIRINGSFLAVIRRDRAGVGGKTDRVFFFPANEIIHVEGVTVDVNVKPSQPHVPVGIASE